MTSKLDKYEIGKLSSQSINNSEIKGKILQSFLLSHICVDAYTNRVTILRNVSPNPMKAQNMSISSAMENYMDDRKVEIRQKYESGGEFSRKISTKLKRDIYNSVGMTSIIRKNERLMDIRSHDKDSKIFTQSGDSSLNRNKNKISPKTRSKINSGIAKAIKQSKGIHHDSEKISKIRIKNLSKRRDGSILVSKRLKNMSPINSHPISRRDNMPSNLLSTKYEHSSKDSIDENQNESAFPNINKHNTTFDT